MKSIADFVLGKIRRAEVGALVSFHSGGDPHPELGACEGRIGGPNGEAILYERGLAIGDTTLAYDAIDRIDRSSSDVMVTYGDRTLRIASSEAGGEVLFATLRWIGNALLRRDLTS